METLKNVTTRPGIIPPQYQDREYICKVYRDIGPGFERLFVGYVAVGGTPAGNGIE